MAVPWSLGLKLLVRFETVELLMAGLMGFRSVLVFAWECMSEMV